MKRRIVSVLLALIMLLGLLPVSALAESMSVGAQDPNAARWETSTVIYVNPLYEGIVTEQEIEDYADSVDPVYPRFGPFDSYRTVNDAAAYVRTCMESRQTSISVCYYINKTV